MRLGICGWSQSGKSTVFDVLAGGEVHDHPSGRSRLGVGHVRDERVGWLAELFGSKKTGFATVEYIDLPGLLVGPHSQGVNPGTLADVRQSDALIAVLRDFKGATVPLPFGDLDPVRDYTRLRDELVFADLEMAQRRIEKLEKDIARPTQHVDHDKAELALLERVKGALEAEGGVDSVEMNDAERVALKGFRFLTDKPLLVLLNRGEEGTGKASGFSAEDFGRPVVEMFAKLELELDQLPLDERKVFTAEMGLDHLAARDVVARGFEILDLVTFLTANEKEAHAWTVPRGTTAVRAAGAIHSDMERGFIRAQVISFEELKTLGSIREARSHGKLRLEGRDYAVADGDVIEFRFSV